MSVTPPDFDARPAERDEQPEDDHRHADEMRRLVARVLVVGRVETHLLFEGLHRGLRESHYNSAFYTRADAGHARVHCAGEQPVGAHHRQFRRRAPRPSGDARAHRVARARPASAFLRAHLRTASARILHAGDRPGAAHAPARQAGADGRGGREPGARGALRRAPRRARRRALRGGHRGARPARRLAAGGARFPLRREARRRLRAARSGSRGRHGIELEAMPEVALQGERVSSSAVRAALAAGDLAAAAAAAGQALCDERARRARREARARARLSDGEHRAAQAARRWRASSSSNAASRARPRGGRAWRASGGGRR